MKVELERMGQGHALTVAITWKLNPGELDELKRDEDLRLNLISLLAADASTQITRHLLTKLTR